MYRKQINFPLDTTESLNKNDKDKDIYWYYNLVQVKYE